MKQDIKNLLGLQNIWVDSWKIYDDKIIVNVHHPKKSCMCVYCTCNTKRIHEYKTRIKKRGLVRTNNITGERGEFLVIETYNKTSNISNLQAAPEGTQNVDALSRKGER